MASFVLSRRAESDLRALDRETVRRVLDAIEKFAATGHGDVRKLQGSAADYRLRVGPWRVRFERESDETYRILRVLNRRDAYRG